MGGSGKLFLGDGRESPNQLRKKEGCRAGSASAPQETGVLFLGGRTERWGGGESRGRMEVG